MLQQLYLHSISCHNWIGVLCALCKLCIANARALRSDSFRQGRRWICQMLDAAAWQQGCSATLHAHLRQSSCRLIPWMWHMLNSGCCLHVHCGIEQVSATNLPIFMYWGFSIKINSNKYVVTFVYAMCFWTRSRLSSNSEYLCDETLAAKFQLQYIQP